MEKEQEPLARREALPVRWRRALGTKMFLLREQLVAVAKAVRHRKVDLVLVEAKELRTGKPVNVFYFGNYQNYKWIFSTFFSEFRVLETAGGLSALQAVRIAAEFEDRTDLAILDLKYVHSLLLRRSARDYMWVPNWVPQVIKIGRSREELEDALRKQGKLKFVHRVQKNGITCRITDSEDDFRDFYRNYYLPHAGKRFGENALTDSEPLFIRCCGLGKVMQILRGDEVIAYSMLMVEDNQLRSGHTGISQTIDAETGKLAFNALYYYAALYACENGFDRLHLGYARPMLNDGVYIFKKRWGGMVHPCPGVVGNMFIKPVRFTDAVRSIFSANYFLSVKDGRIISKILCEEDQLSIPFVERIARDNFSEGIDGVTVFSLGKTDPRVADWCLENAPYMKIVDLDGAKNPLEAFCAQPL